MAITLPKGSLIKINNTELSEHNRSSAQITWDFIKYDARTVTGVMRRLHVAAKRRIEVSWEMLPALDAQTVDGKAGRNTLASLVMSEMGNTVAVRYYTVNSSNQQVETTFTGFIDSYSETLVKRFGAQYWNISLSIVEQ